jgi:hypothetical protein
VTLVTDINTTEKGIIQCKLTRTTWYGAEVVYADMWQTQMFLESRITSFRAAVSLQWDGHRYNILDRRYKNCNDFWRELEIQLSNTIIVNE